MPPPKDARITAEAVAIYNTLLPLVESMHADIRELTKKNQTVPLSKSRIKMLNRLLLDVKDLLAAEPTAQYLPLLDEATVPQNAGALLILGQFRAALGQFEKKYTEYDEDEELAFWRVGGKSRIPKHKTTEDFQE